VINPIHPEKEDIRFCIGEISIKNDDNIVVCTYGCGSSETNGGNNDDIIKNLDHFFLYKVNLEFGNNKNKK